MRGLVLVLFALAIVGMGGGLAAFVILWGSKGFADAFLTVSIPLLMGTIALSGVTICLAVDEARKDIVAKLGGE